MKISYCVHAHNRLPQLQATLGPNLSRLAGEIDVEVVLLDYHSPDGMAEWVREQFGAELLDRKLVFARELHAERFHMAHSKNLAHKLARGEFLINLDCDNFIAPGEVARIRELLALHPRAAMHFWSGVPRDGTHGRIGIARELFHRLRGYDEGMLPVGYQDIDLLKRAQRLGVSVLSPVRENGCFEAVALRNEKALTIRDCGIELPWESMNEANRWLSQQRIARLGYRTNPYGWGRGEVEINFRNVVRI